jgi:hypothetical protein
VHQDQLKVDLLLNKQQQGLLKVHQELHKVELVLVTIMCLLQEEDKKNFGWLVGKPCDTFASKQHRGVFFLV